MLFATPLTNIIIFGSLIIRHSLLALRRVMLSILILLQVFVLMPSAETCRLESLVLRVLLVFGRAILLFIIGLAVGAGGNGRVFLEAEGRLIVQRGQVVVRAGWECPSAQRATRLRVYLVQLAGQAVESLRVEQDLVPV